MLNLHNQSVLNVDYRFGKQKFDQDLKNCFVQREFNGIILKENLQICQEFEISPPNLSGKIVWPHSKRFLGDEPLESCLGFVKFIEIYRGGPLLDRRGTKPYSRAQKTLQMFENVATRCKILHQYSKVFVDFLGENDFLSLIR